MIVTAGATVLHRSLGEGSSTAITALLFVLTSLVAYRRWKVKPIVAIKASAK
jgi:hypothetical protein